MKKVAYAIYHVPSKEFWGRFAYKTFKSIGDAGFYLLKGDAETLKGEEDVVIKVTLTYELPTKGK